MSDVSIAGLEAVLERAKAFSEVADREIKKVPALRGRTVLNIFTDGESSGVPGWILAENRLSADVLTLRPQHMSLEPGEALEETLKRLAEAGPSAVVIRLPEVGVVRALSQATAITVVNAGDAHAGDPCQAIADVFTLSRRLGELPGRSIGFIGDLLGQPAARSVAELFRRVGCRITVYAPLELIPENAALQYPVERSLDQAHQEDALYVVPIVRPRSMLSVRQYAQEFQLRTENLGSGQVVMQLPPVRPGLEIDAAVADTHHWLARKQAADRTSVQMAILYQLLIGSGITSGSSAEDAASQLLVFRHLEPDIQAAIGPFLTPASLRALREGVSDASEARFETQPSSADAVLPAFQFDEAGDPIPMVTEAVRAFREAGVDPVSTAIWFVTSNPLLDSLSPSEWLERVRDPEPSAMREAAKRALVHLGR